MRANITYSVSVKTIPEEVMRIIRSECDSILRKFDLIYQTLGDENFTKTRKVILDAREALGDADIRLYELDQILAGYIEMVNREETPPSEATEDELSESGEQL